MRGEEEALRDIERISRMERAKVQEIRHRSPAIRYLLDYLELQSACDNGQYEVIERLLTYFLQEAMLPSRLVRHVFELVSPFLESGTVSLSEANQSVLTLSLAKFEGSLSKDSAVNLAQVLSPKSIFA